MIISTKKGTPKEELEKIVDKFEKQGLDVTLITGKDYNVFGLVGDTTKIDERDVLANPWIDNVTRVSAPYKRANRLFHPADSVIDCGGVKIGSKEKIAVMAGPCSIENAEQALRIAQGVKAGGASPVPRRCLQAPHLSLLLPGSGDRGHPGHGKGPRGHRPAHRLRADERGPHPGV